MIVKALAKTAAATATLLAPLSAFAQGFAGSITPFEGTVEGDLISGITAVVNVFLALIALIAVIFILIGGIKYITSGGDEDAAASAKNTILYAIIGLIVIAFSAVIVNFVLGSFT